jgi:hypothetical protein
VLHALAEALFRVVLRGYRRKSRRRPHWFAGVRGWPAGGNGRRFERVRGHEAAR